MAASINISHAWMLDHIPADKEVLRKWLKAGFMENRTLFPTEAGTPQGGIISPTLANLTLDGLERLLKATFDRRAARWKADNPKVNFVRYADDFIITGSSKELLEDEVKPLVERFLLERGLQLSPEKTCITHIEDGFDFLGQNVRKYDGKLLITPSKKNMHAFLEKVRGVIRQNRSANQESLIRMLNPIIRGLGKLSPSYLGVFSVPEDGNGPLALALAMGEVSPPQQDLCLDHKAILASAWRTEMVLRCGGWP